MFTYSAELTNRIKLSNKTYELEMLPSISFTNDLKIHNSVSETKKINAKYLQHPKCLSRLVLPDKIGGVQLNLHRRHTFVFSLSKSQLLCRIFLHIQKCQSLQFKFNLASIFILAKYGNPTTSFLPASTTHSLAHNNR